MIQRPDSREHIADEVVARITGAMRPWRIVLFGSRARESPNDDSDYDMYVEVDAERSELKRIDSEIRQLFSGTHWRLDFKVAERGTIERRRDDPGTIEWDVAREGKLLYADAKASTVLPPPDRVRERPFEPPESMHEWVEAAERDLRHCNKLRDSNDGWWPEVCWLSHQCAEKYLKALLVARRVRPKRTHDLTELLGALRAASLELPDLDGDCVLLTKHAITPRYPAGLNLGEEDARTAFAALERVVRAVRALLPPRLR